ncbi:MAG TPA: ATP-dependent helicase [Gemmatimonadales bacterium]|nr:ATP-dependent helicase [Gemmatimonadales bacterium]
MTTATQPALFVPSPQQAAIFDFITTGRGSANVEAVAGAGKTTTLEQALSRTTGSVAFCAYNKKIATEIQSRVARLPGDVQQRVTAGTFHSFGNKAMYRAFGKVPLNDKKTLGILVALAVPEQFHEFCVKAVSLAKQMAVGVLCSYDDQAAWWGMVNHHELDESLSSDGVTEVGRDLLVTTGIRYAIAALKESVARNPKEIDFDDMIYGPLVHDLKVWQHDWVFVDEAQDTNPARRALAKKLLKPGGRAVFVGDSRQAIYGFTGADANAMDLIAQQFGCIALPLTVTYRCPKAVVAHAHKWVSHIEAHPSAPEGDVGQMDHAIFAALTPRPTDVILCRNTKPLVQLAYGYIRRGVACHVEGREIGRGLLALAGKWKVTRLDALLKRLESYLETETARLLGKGQEQRADALADRVGTLAVLCEALPAGSTVNDLRDLINRMFADTADGQPQDRLTLSTIHKAKGREWNRVYLYGRNLYQPSPYARQDWQLGQEDNLCYVAVTRAKATLIEVVV